MEAARREALRQFGDLDARAIRRQDRQGGSVQRRLMLDDLQRICGSRRAPHARAVLAATIVRPSARSVRRP
jgi:hypothetical protein